MKQLCVAVALFVSLLTQAQEEEEFNLKNPGDYNNYIMREMASAVRKNFEYISFVVHNDDYEQLEKKRQDVIDQILDSKNKIGGMPPFEGNTDLRDAAIHALDEYKNAFELDYKEVIGLKRKSRDSYESMEAYFKAEDKAEEKVNKATLQLRKAQQVYASKNKMTIAEPRSQDALEEKMRKAREVNMYWREIYIIYFKVSREYDRLWNLLEEQKAAPLDHQRSVIEKVSRQALDELKQKDAFNGNREFLDQTINVIEYYSKTAQVEFGQITELLRKKNLTQQDVDTINTIINKCNADHERLAYNWNIASQELLQNNIDKE